MCTIECEYFTFLLRLLSVAPFAALTAASTAGLCHKVRHKLKSVATAYFRTILDMPGIGDP